MILSMYRYINEFFIYVIYFDYLMLFSLFIVLHFLSYWAENMLKTVVWSQLSINLFENLSSIDGCGNEFLI